MNNFWEKLPKPILALAPMAGVTDAAFRKMCKSGGADVIYTEFASADALVYESVKTKEMLSFDEIERPVVVQIFGRKPEMFFKAVKHLEEMGFDGIDINFGCPAYKVVKQGGGVKLMRNLSLCEELVQAACEGTSLPISIKIRASIKADTKITDKIETTEESDCTDNLSSSYSSVTALDLVKKIHHLPVKAIMIHGRSYEQPFDGEPNLGVIKEVRKLWSGVLLANGGIYTPEKAQEVMTETGADGVGIARGSWGKPWLFNQIKQFIKTGEYNNLDWHEIKQIMYEHARLTFEAKGSYGLIELRKHLAWYVKGLDGAAALRARLVHVSNLADVEEILKNTQ